jgi:hypothetical protein
MKAYWGVTWVLAGDELSASHPGCLTPGERAPWYPLDWRLSGPQIRSGQRGEVKILDAKRARNLTYPFVVQPAASHYTGSFR